MRWPDMPPEYPRVGDRFVIDYWCYCRHCSFSADDVDRVTVHIVSVHSVGTEHVRKGRDYIWGAQLLEERKTTEFAQKLFLERADQQLESLTGPDDLLYEAEQSIVPPPMEWDS